jgi:uncharacterized protein
VSAPYSLGEVHRFPGSGAEYAYLVASGGIVSLDDLSARVLSHLESGALSRAELVAQLKAEGFAAEDIQDAIHELDQLNAIHRGPSPSGLSQALPDHFPLQTMVLNLTNQCNLSCQYCYEFGEDKVATPEGKKKFMDWETARTSVDFLFAESEGRNSIHITFFGGETLMNFPLLKQVVQYAQQEAERRKVAIDFSLTTNATLLTPAIIDFLAANAIGVTVSMDGARESHDAFRVFKNGRGTYDVIEPKIKELLAKHKTRPIAARVTMTSQAMDVLGTYKHLKHTLGFHEVGFAPVTTSPNRLYSIAPAGMNNVLGQFQALAEEYLEYSKRGEHHGFSNVSDTLAELHQGVNKSLPCGAGLGLLGVGPSGDIAPCHRFVDSDTHNLGSVTTGIDKEKQAAFLKRGNIDNKYDCHTCWARPLCAGGCHHEAFVRYGDTGHPNLHYCDWIRSWTDTCLRIYGTIAAENPAFLDHFSERKAS